VLTIGTGDGEAHEPVRLRRTGHRVEGVYLDQFGQGMRCLQPHAHLGSRIVGRGQPEVVDEECRQGGRQLESPAEALMPADQAGGGSRTAIS
jgi:hypothetical protein